MQNHPAVFRKREGKRMIFSSRSSAHELNYIYCTNKRLNLNIALPPLARGGGPRSGGRVVAKDINKLFVLLSF